MRLWTAILAGLQILTAAAGLGDLIGPRWASGFVLLVAALQGGTVVYMRSDQGYRPQHQAKEL